MSPLETTQRYLLLKEEKKKIDEELKMLETSLFKTMNDLGIDSLPFTGLGKATIVKTTKTQITDEHKVIEKIREIGMYDEYVEPRLKDIFSIKDFIKEHGVIDGISQYESEPYLKVTPTKDITVAPDA